jgi:hypothetical protein
MEESEQQLKNAPTPIDESFEPDSNETVERDRHPRKHISPSVVTENGMHIDESEEQLRNAAFPMEDS